MAIYNVGERDIVNVRVILASFGIFAVDMTDIMRWGFMTRRDIIGTLMTSHGRKKSKAESYCPVWVFEDQACNRNLIYEKDPLGAWKEIENKPRVVIFFGRRKVQT
jgi:hypothetical protein